MAESRIRAETVHTAGSEANMAKKINITAALLFAGTVILSVLYRLTSNGIFLSLAVTAGTFTYHFVMRLLVGLLFRIVMKNRADCTRRWYRVGRLETELYRKLRVRKWKGKMPTYDPERFDPRIHTWDEIAQATCQAELVHETIALLSFLPILAGIRFGAYPVFIVTSVLAAAFDMMFVMIQRYNRLRILKLIEHKARLKQKKPHP